MEDTPRIQGKDAKEYLKGVEKRNIPLIIVGDAPGHWMEFFACLVSLPVKHKFIFIDNFGNEAFKVIDVMTINAAGLKAPVKVQYVATLHSARFGTEGHEKYHPGVIPKGAQVHGLEVGGVENKDVVKHTWAIDPAGGTSGLFGVVVGLCLGYQKIYTVGIHLNSERYYDEHIDRNWRKVWYPIFKDHVRGWSGLPKEIYSDRF